MVALLLLSFGCLVTLNVPWLFLTVPWVGQQFVIVLFSDHTHLFLDFPKRYILNLKFMINRMILILK